MQDPQQPPIVPPVQHGSAPSLLANDNNHGTASNNNNNNNNNDNDVHKMAMTPEEIIWAHTIKQAIDSEPNLHNISDLECAQWAIVTLPRQNIQEVVDRVWKLQCFREQYNLYQIGEEGVLILGDTRNNNPEEVTDIAMKQGMGLVKEFMNQQPGMILSCEYMPAHGHFLLIIDMAVYNPALVESLPGWRTMIGACYYFHEVANTHVQAMRLGFATILDFYGVGPRNINLSQEERWTVEFYNYYPFIQKNSMWLNTPTLANVLYATYKPFLSEEFKATITLGCQLDGHEGSISSLFHQPSLDAAQNKTLNLVEVYLRERIHNQLHFRLPPLPLQDADDPENVAR